MLFKNLKPGSRFIFHSDTIDKLKNNEGIGGYMKLEDDPHHNKARIEDKVVNAINCVFDPVHIRPDEEVVKIDSP